MENMSITIERITKDNYHMFDDMVHWRIHGVERSCEDKEKNKVKGFEREWETLGHQDFYAYGALCEGRFVGWIMFVYIPKLGRWNGGVIFVEELWTSPKFRRRGIAYKLMEKPFEIQQQTDAVKVRLYTDNEPAVKLYEKCGLKITNKAVFMESE
jgi:ribosomal protein S18 acetylase RimI-like enzyme